MPRARKKPMEVEVHQFWENSPDGWPVGVYRDEGRHMIDTLEGPLHVSEGDWIITGVKGERWPVKPDIFALTYDLLPESAVEGRGPKSWDVQYSGGSRTISLGDTVHMHGIAWTVEAPDGVVYSPSSLGGAMSFRLRPHAEIPRILLTSVEADGTVAFCGDSIAAAMASAVEKNGPPAECNCLPFVCMQECLPPDTACREETKRVSEERFTDGTEASKT